MNDGTATFTQDLKSPVGVDGGGGGGEAGYHDATGWSVAVSVTDLAGSGLGSAVIVANVAEQFPENGGTLEANQLFLCDGQPNVLGAQQTLALRGAPDAGGDDDDAAQA